MAWCQTEAFKYQSEALKWQVGGQVFTSIVDLARAYFFPYSFASQIPSPQLASPPQQMPAITDLGRSIPSIGVGALADGIARALGH